MNKNLFYIWFILSNIVFAGLQDTTFNKYDEVNNVFESYLLVVDEKNITKMSKYFQTDWCTLHFGSGIPIVITNKEEFNIVFNNWKNSSKANFVKTKLDKIEIAPVWDHIDTKLCTVDATYSRLNEQGEVLGTGRALYHFVRHKYSGLYRFFKKWKKWKIYMITDLDPESRD